MKKAAAEGAAAFFEKHIGFIRAEGYKSEQMFENILFLFSAM